jgi:hypothetical protein
MDFVAKNVATGIIVKVMEYTLDNAPVVIIMNRPLVAHYFIN